MNRTIMLIDDDEDEFLILSEALRLVGKPFDCIYENNADRALSQLDTQAPDCIFIDMNMPKTDGLSCINKMMLLLGEKEIPIILYSTTISANMCYTAISCGAIGCIQKPKSIPQLAEVLQNFFCHIFKMEKNNGNFVSKGTNTNDIVILQGKDDKKAFLYIDR